jgi:CRISPR-associated protein Csb2
VGTILALRFPLGRYHATPWDRSANEGAVEWPPSSWRLLRALVATWYTRWPDLPAPVLDGLLDALGDPPSCRVPPASPGHTRHYLPGLDHQSGEPGRTDLTLDPFLWIPRDEELYIRWDLDLRSEQRQVLAKLAELLPYLGRAESACEARLLDEDIVPDELWWRPGADGDQQVRLLVPARPVSRPALELSTTAMRKQRRTLPPGSAWIRYGATSKSLPQQSPPSDEGRVTAVRFAVTGPVPLKSTHAVLLADDAHRVVGSKLQASGISDDRRREILGSGKAQTGHSHAHWVPIAEGHHRGAAVKSLVLWVPQGLHDDELAAIICMPRMSGQRGGDGYEVTGYPEVRLLFQAAGTIKEAAPELRGPARCWRSLTPYLPVRHRKRETLAEYLTADIAAEFRYRDSIRGMPAPSATPLDPAGVQPDRWAREFRRYRLTERLRDSRPGLALRLDFGQEVPGPLLLGQLSHFGYGIFTPDHA